MSSIKTTLDIGGTPVSLRYPSDGTERPYEGPPGYRLFLRGHDEDIHSPSRVPEGERIEIEAPVTALFKDVAKALGQFHDQVYEASLYDWKSCLWDDQASRRNPSPRIADLAELEEPAELEIEIGGGAFDLAVGPALDRPRRPGCSGILRLRRLFLRHGSGLVVAPDVGTVYRHDDGLWNDGMYQPGPGLQRRNLPFFTAGIYLSHKRTYETGESTGRKEGNSVAVGNGKSHLPSTLRARDYHLQFRPLRIGGI